MRIFLSPAKKMRQDPDSLPVRSRPVYLDRAEQILCYLRTLNRTQLQQLWGCNDRIAAQNFERLERMDLRQNLTPAILAYDGLAFQYMAPGAFEDRHFDYVQEHLRILSGLYGVLRPMDGVQAYRLEMQAQAKVNGTENLYEFWGDCLYRQVRSEDGVILNLASREYAKCIEKYLTPEDRMITCIFGQMSGNKPVQKPTFAKMARGEMVRFLAECQAQNPAQIQEFDRLGFSFCEELSQPQEYVFLRDPSYRM